MMPLHRRHVPNSQDQSEENEDYKSEGINQDQMNKNRLIQPQSPRTAAKRPLVPGPTRLKIILIAVVQIVIMKDPLMNMIFQRGQKSFVTVLTAFVGSLPFSLVLAVGLGAIQEPLLPHQQYIPLAFMACIASNQVPQFITSAVVSMGLFLFGLASRPIHEGSIETAGKATKTEAKPTSISESLKLVLVIFLLIAVLLTENFFIWVVSATNYRSQDKSNLPEPLQDNGQILLRYLFDQALGFSKRDIVRIRNTVNVQWALVTGLGLSFVTLELQGRVLGRHMWPMARRAVLTLAISRSVRTISFLITVLPSQNTKCYFQHFPTPPADWASWLMVGFTPQSNGGCNDLIISGHATVTATLTCVMLSVVDCNVFSIATWMLLGMDYMVEIYEGFHYSVDMFLGAVLVSLVWKALAPIEQNVSNAQSPFVKFKPIGDISTRDCVVYAIPAVGAFLQASRIIPKVAANYTIMAFVIAAVSMIVKYGVTQYTQHIIFSLLYIALSSYL